MSDAFVELGNREALKITLRVLLPLFLGSLGRKVSPIYVTSLSVQHVRFGDIGPLGWCGYRRSS